MKAEQVQVIAYRDSGGNTPFEWLVACVDKYGVLHQMSGIDEDIAQDVESICRTRKSVFAQMMEKKLQEDDAAARERGDTPEMPRNAPTLTPARSDRPNPLTADLGKVPE